MFRIPISELFTEPIVGLKIWGGSIIKGQKWGDVGHLLWGSPYRENIVYGRPFIASQAFGSLFGLKLFDQFGLKIA